MTDVPTTQRTEAGYFAETRDGQNLLEVRQLSKRFGGVQAVDGVSFSVREGELAAIIGPNGSGKTTILNVISGLLEATSGGVFYRGKPINGCSPVSLAKLGVSRTFQNLRLFTNLSVLENVMMGRQRHTKSGMLSASIRFPTALREERAVREAALENLALVGLTSKADSPPLALPYGQQKLLELARALACEPRLLLMDEPAGGLSTAEIEQLAELILAIRSTGVTILLVEHRMGLVMGVADKVVVLDFGQKIAEGTPAEVQSNKQVIDAYLGDEFWG